jgi:hypothetical protein
VEFSRLLGRRTLAPRVVFKSTSPTKMRRRTSSFAETWRVLQSINLLRSTGRPDLKNNRKPHPGLDYASCLALSWPSADLLCLFTFTSTRFQRHVDGHHWQQEAPNGVCVRELWRSEEIQTRSNRRKMKVRTPLRAKQRLRRQLRTTGGAHPVALHSIHIERIEQYRAHRHIERR